jgi:carbamoyl-phosphate synthase small subunit
VVELGDGLRGRIELARSRGVGHAAIHNGTNHFLSTFRGQASILMSVHSVTPRIAKVWQHQRSGFGPNGQPPESSQLGAWLEADGVPGITGIDTRTLTRRLREHGTMKGWLLPAADHPERARNAAETVDMKEVFRLVAPDNVIRYEGGPLKVLLVDAGAKDNMVRSLLKRGATVVRAPWHTDLAPLAAECDGIVIGNGPGDPKDLTPLVTQVRSLLPSYRKPVFGICLGHQILALAADGDTYKLPYGHRGVNQPVQDLITRRCYITSQNHGYAVRQEALPADWEPWFVNVNDGTSEGIRARSRPFFSVQFHPEASPGPEDTAFLFDDFMRLVGAMARA